MRKKILSIAIATAVGVSALSPAAADAAEATPPVIQSTQSVIQGFIANPVGTVISFAGMSAVMPFVLSSWMGYDILPD
ncbi:hypothetical protein N24_2326 [Corynebacterium suranareeae]|uniref:Secreted protein n=1 Tax=Corynebacterium suranareeae TaxID=2506452 RepID=A0A161JMI9_9CORY|nr:hypothetical protein [Corynebacterium suranareeae]BAU96588.1 hypothetical protein N24_2326 [Corynebacterium suranareeae]